MENWWKCQQHVHYIVKNKQIIYYSPAVQSLVLLSEMDLNRKVLNWQSEKIKHVISGYCFVYNFLTFPVVNNKLVYFIVIATKNWYKTHRTHKSKVGHINSKEWLHFISHTYTLLFCYLVIISVCRYISVLSKKKKRDSTEFVLFPKHWTLPINYCSLVIEVILWTASARTKQL